MKVSVCFGETRILVPCGNGDLLVKDLITDAIRRFKKASGKDPDAWIPVHHFQTQSGILDPDDRVRDVADDREYIQACFGDSVELNFSSPQNCGDGASRSSSLGHASPETLNNIATDVCDIPTYDLDQTATTHIEVTNNSVYPTNRCGLQVRRSSDPNILVSCRAEETINNKRWSAAAPQCGNATPERVLQIGEKCKSTCLSPQWEEDADDRIAVDSEILHVEQPATLYDQQQSFIRSGRYSMQFLGDGNGFQWMEAAEKLRHQYQRNKKQESPANEASTKGSTVFKRNSDFPYRPNRSLPHEHKRKEPLGQALETIRDRDVKTLFLMKEFNSPLGLTAITDKEYTGVLLVQHVEPNSSADLGQVQKGDRILEINNVNLIGLGEREVQECLKKALDGTQIQMKVVRQGIKLRKTEVDCRTSEMINIEEKKSTTEETKVATVSPTYKYHASLPGGTSLQIANTRKLGLKIKITLKKGSNGLGFSVTTRDNPAGGHCPIYIKNILSRGAAIEDGHLKPGDRLLEINGVSVIGKTQSDVVSILRGTETGSNVTLLVSRPHELINYDQERDVDMKTDNLDHTIVSTPSPFNAKYRTLRTDGHSGAENLNSGSQHFIDAGSESTASSDSLQTGLAWPSRERMVFHIPVHDTEKAGLGVSVKGKTSSNGSTLFNTTLKYDGDLGIFVKNVIHGGAASRDGRLEMNDQLISVNGVSLLGKSNSEAMKSLKYAIVNNPGEHPGMITLEVLRRKLTRSASSNDAMESNKENNFNVSENNGTTVIYLGKEQKDHEGKKSHVTMMNEVNRWSNPIVDRLTGGTCALNSAQKNNSYHTDGMAAAESMRPNNYCPRNESYCLATASYKDWPSPTLQRISSENIKYPMSTSSTTYLRDNSNRTNNHSISKNNNSNNNVLIEDEIIGNQTKALIFPNCSTNSTTTSEIMGPECSSTRGQHLDSTYSSQLSIETNNSSAGVEHFSRDALGRRSISEKHHAALDAKETGTYQRNKKLRENRERERRLKLTKSLVFGGSVESLTTQINQANINVPSHEKHNKIISTGTVNQHQIQPQPQQQFKQTKLQAARKMDRTLVSRDELGPFLGLKKSSSLESLQTMVQELQMCNDRDISMTLKSPCIKKRNDYLHLQSGVKQDQYIANGEIDTSARKHWLLEEFDCNNGGFEVQRNCLLQSSMNEGKMKARTKKSNGILRGIGSMFRFGKTRKDIVMPLELQSQQPKTVTLPSYVGYNSNQQVNNTSDQLSMKNPLRPTPSFYSQQQNTVPDKTTITQPTSLGTRPEEAIPSKSASFEQSIDKPIGTRSENAGIEIPISGDGGNSGIHQNDLFNHRYPHFRNYEQLCNPHKSSSKSQRQLHTYRSQRNQRSVQNHKHQAPQYIPISAQPRYIGSSPDCNSYNATTAHQYDEISNFAYRHGNSKHITDDSQSQYWKDDINDLTTERLRHQQQQIQGCRLEPISRTLSTGVSDPSVIHSNVRVLNASNKPLPNNMRNQHHVLSASSTVTPLTKV